MRVLVFNCGTDSIRFKVIDPDKNIAIAKGGIEAISTSNSYVEYYNYEKELKTRYDYSEGFENSVFEIFTLLTDDIMGVYGSIAEVEAVGHRIVHGGEKYFQPIIIEDEVLKDIRDYGSLAPIHNLKSAKVIEICREEISNELVNVGVFDTAFHSTIPDFNFRYPIPNELYYDSGVRKYGFHGISYQNIMRNLPQVLNKDIKDINAVIVHLGSGSSMCCIKNGKSYDTTMGYTPLDGLMMSTRSGSVDPSIVSKICERYKCGVNDAIEILNKKSGYLGICGESDIKTICDKSDDGDELSTFARIMARQNFKKNLFAMVSELDTIDAIVVTGGMGVKNSRQRELFLSNLGVLDTKLDLEKNRNCFNELSVISKDNSAIKIINMPSDEEMEIAIQTESVIMGD